RTRFSICLMTFTAIVLMTVAAPLAAPFVPYQAGAAKGQASAGPDAALVQKIWNAWESLDPAKAAQFYAKDAANAFYDIAPLKYTGWNEYAEGVKTALAEYSSAKMKVGNDLRIHKAGNSAWATATVAADLMKKAGGKDSMVIRWTAVWEKRGED